jgi:plastocyanin
MHHRTTGFARLSVLGVALLVLPPASSCGSSPSSPSESNPTVVIGAAGVSPNVLRVKAWSQVTFVNNDTRPHAIASDPVDMHTDCPPLNSVGLLLPGESRDTRTLNLPGTCSYHDHNNHTAAAFRGQIIVE